MIKLEWMHGMSIPKSFEVRPSAISFQTGPRQAVIPLEYIAEGIEFVRKNAIASIEIETLEPHLNPLLVDFSFLDQLPDLIGFECRMNISKKSDLKPLFRCKKLKQLGWPARTTPPIDLSFFPRLECLSIKHRDSTVGWNALHRLNYLRLSLSDNLDLKVISHLNSLVRLEVSDASIVSMTGIERLDNLERIDIFSLPKLMDISSIAMCKSLKILHVNQTRRLTDFSVLAESNSIEQLRLLTRVDSVDFIPAMKSLKKFFCNALQTNDLSPLLKASSLVYFDIQPRKRTHDPSVEDIIVALGIQRQ